MRVVVIGGTGHIGTFLTPRLFQAGHAVVCVSRGLQTPYRAHAAWNCIERVEMDRAAEEQAGRFGERIARLAGDAVIDLTCYELASARQLAQALRGTPAHLVHCGTIWVHGPSVEVPTVETEPRRPFGAYGEHKAAIEAFLLKEAQAGFAVRLLHPGHIVGPGWVPVNPAAHFNPQIFSRLLSGATVTLPNIGMETLHHVHADDVAQCFARAIERKGQALGESFHVVSPAALTLRGYAERLSARFGKTARLQFLPWEAWKDTVTEREAAVTWDHIAHSPNCSIAKARRLLGYAPRFSSLDAVQESLEWLIARGTVADKAAE